MQDLVPGSPLERCETTLNPSSFVNQSSRLRLINHSDEGGTVTIEAFDDAGIEHGPVSLDIEASGAAHFNTLNLELGNPDKGLTEGTAAGSDDRRLALGSYLTVGVLAYQLMNAVGDSH